MRPLYDIMFSHGSDKSWKGYCTAYEQWFGPLRSKELVLLELGIGGEDTELGGASLKGWAEYFSNAFIAGIDIYDKSALDIPTKIHTFKGSQTDREFLDSVLAFIGTPDIIIDDASHINVNTIESFRILFPKLQPGGLYIIEDLSCTYRWDFGGSILLNDMQLPTIMNYLFSMLHDLNPVKIGNEHYPDNPDFIGVGSIHFYPDMVVITKL